MPAIVAALFGSSWHLVSGPTTAASIVLYSSLSAFAAPGSADYVQLALTLAFMVGAIEIAMGLFRLGALVNFISHSVVIGFTAGAGILIAANQVKNFFGLPVPPGATFHDVAVFLVEHIGDISPAVTAVGFVTLVTGILARRLIPRIPHMIVAIVAGSFFSAYVATGSFNRSGLNYDAGAQTPVAAMIGGVGLLAVIVLVAPLAAYLPNAAMAGILFLVAWGLIDFKHIAQVARASRSETVVLAVTFLATLFFPLEFAIFAGVPLSLLLYLNRTSHPTILSRVPDPAAVGRKFTSADHLPECPQVKILRIDGSLFFGAVNYFQETLRAYARKKPDQRHIALFMSGVNFVDVAGAGALTQESRRQRERGVPGLGSRNRRSRARLEARLGRGAVE